MGEDEKQDGDDDRHKENFSDYAVAGVECPHCNLGSLIGVKDEDYELDGEEVQLMMMVPPEKEGLLDKIKNIIEDWEKTAEELPDIYNVEVYSNATSNCTEELKKLVAHYDMEWAEENGVEIEPIKDFEE